MQLEKENREAMTKAWELLPGQRQTLYSLTYAPEDSFLNLHSMIKLKPEVDEKRMEEAVNLVLQKHPSLCLRIFQDEESGSWYQQYDPALFSPVHTEELSEESLPGKIAALQTPFSLENERLYRCGLIRTEEGLYLYFVIHHVISDQSAMNLMMTQFLETYRTGSFSGEEDYYFYLLKQLAEKKEAAPYEEARAYFAKRFDERIKEGIPLGARPDHDSKDRTLATIIHPIEKKENRDVNFLKTAAVLACAWYNDTKFAFLQTVNADRFDPLRQASTGFFATLLTVGLDLTEDESPKALLEQIREQNQFARTHTEYCYIQDKIGDSSLMLRMNYQKDAMGWMRQIDLFERPVKFPESKMMSGVMGLSFLDSTRSDKIQLFLRYASGCYQKESMERYLSLFDEAIQYLEKPE